MIKSRRGLHFLLGKTRRLGRGVGVERRAFNVAAARPESRAAHFLRISLAGDRIGADAFRSAPPREPRHAQIEASPEKMYRTVLANESGPEFPEDVVTQNQDLPEAVRIFGIVRSMLRVAGKANRVWHLAWHGPDFHLYAERPQGRHELRIKIGDRFRLQRESVGRSPTGLDDQLVIDDVELHLEVCAVIRNRGSGEPARV